MTNSKHFQFFPRIVAATLTLALTIPSLATEAPDVGEAVEAFVQAQQFRGLCSANKIRLAVRKRSLQALTIYGAYAFTKAFATAALRVTYRRLVEGGAMGLPESAPQRVFVDNMEKVVSQLEEPGQILRRGSKVGLVLGGLAVATLILDDPAVANAFGVVKGQAHTWFPRKEQPLTVIERYVTDGSAFLDEFLKLTPEEAQPYLAVSEDLRTLTVGFGTFIYQVEAEEYGSKRKQRCRHADRAASLSVLRALRGQKSGFRSLR